MLLQYGVKNYFGFKHGAEIDFRLNAKVPKDVSFGRSVSTVIGVKGGNGSGKTNIIKALAFLGEFCANSFSKSEKDIEADSYFKSPKPSEFYIDFSINEIFYRYELETTQNHIKSEVIYRKFLNVKNKKTIKIFERNDDDIIYRAEELSFLDIIILKSKVSIISSAANYKFNTDNPTFKNLHDFFSSIKSNVTYTGLKEVSWSLDGLYNASLFYKNNEEAFNFAKKIIIDCDLGISDIEILSRKDENNSDVYFPIFHHIPNDDDSWLTGHDESSGTKSLYVKLASYWIVLTNGGVLIMDEFDINFHPFMLPKLLDLFENEHTNPKGAQFLFTSHNTEIIDTLGKYRTYLVNKENNESYCYRLDEIKGDILRHGRPISPIYKDGKIGGVPKI